MSKYVICYSGGHSSALCAIEAVRKHGKDNVILLNHDIHSLVEDADIKRFKQQVADYLQLPITYANHDDWSNKTPIDVCVDANAWKVGNGSILCTHRLKTQPFDKWQSINDPNKEFVYIYGFDKSKDELKRANRRSQIMGLKGYKTEFPLISWSMSIRDTTQIGILPPLLYTRFKHANCIGCLKAGWQHWYIVYCYYPHIWQAGKTAEDTIGFSIHKDDDGTPIYLEDKEELFNKMIKAGIQPTERINQSKFWRDVYRKIKEREVEDLAKCDIGVCVECMG